MKAKVVKSNVTVTLEMTEKELDLYMKAMGSVSAPTLKNDLGFTQDQANAVQAVWFAINDANEKKWNTELTG